MYTLEEFEWIDDWNELFDFCEYYNVSCGYDRDYIYTADSLMDCIIDKARDYDWKSIYDIVYDIDDMEGSDDDYYDWSCTSPRLLTDEDLAVAKDEALENLHYEGTYLEGEEGYESDEEEQEEDSTFEDDTVTVTAHVASPPKAASMYGHVEIRDGTQEESTADFSAETFNQMIGG